MPQKAMPWTTPEHEGTEIDIDEKNQAQKEENGKTKNDLHGEGSMKNDFSPKLLGGTAQNDIRSRYMITRSTLE
jgi:hypothetical protein